MKIVRLNRQQLLEWRTNLSHLVDDEGHLVRELEKPLASQLATVERSARSQRKTLTQKVSIGSPPNQREHVIQVVVTRTGNNMDDLSLTSTIDGYRIFSGRDVFCAKMLAEHGECQLRWPNNVILKHVRNPAIRRTSFAESQQIAPKPEHCPCKTWGREHPGRHYPTCQWNRLAPPDEKALTDNVPEEEVRVLPTEAFASLRARPLPNPATTPVPAKVDPKAVIAEAAPLDAPESCRNQCLSWATPKGFPVPKGQHHPTCHFAKAWALKTARETPRWLVDLHTGEKVRHASNSEIGEAEITAQRTGQPIIHIEEVPYAVILETELAEVEDVAVIAPEGKLTPTGTGS